jgi:hypothetical protein
MSCLWSTLALIWHCARTLWLPFRWAKVDGKFEISKTSALLNSLCRNCRSAESMLYLADLINQNKLINKLM